MSERRLYAGPLVTLALLLRLAVVWATERTHSAAWFFNQASELARLAESLRSGQGLSSPFGGNTGPSAFLAPGYPAIVAATFAVFHPYSHAAMVALMLLQACFGAATVVALMLLARRAFGTRAARLAGAVWAISPPLLWLPTLFWETSLSILLATSIAVAALYCAERGSRGTWVGAGVLAAFALTVNPSMLPIIVCCFGWAWYKTRKSAKLLPALALAVCVILCSPWVVRNYLRLHAFIPLRSNMGYELWQGNRPGADGYFVAELHPNVNAREFQRYQTLGEVAYMHEKSKVAKDAIDAEPGRFLGLCAMRAFDFWTGIVRHSTTLIVAYIVLTSAGGMVGLVLLWRRDRALAIFFLLPLILFPAPYYMTHPDFRFRLVVDPLLVALAAYAMLHRSKAEVYGEPFAHENLEPEAG